VGASLKVLHNSKWQFSTNPPISVMPVIKASLTLWFLYQCQY